jgi:hypothetical protein
MDELTCGRAALLAIRDALDMALTELEDVDGSDAIEPVRDAIELIDELLDDDYGEYEEDEYEDLKQTTSELRF